MQLNFAQFKLGLIRTLLRLMPLLLMGGLTLLTFWLVQKNTPPPKDAIERVRLHEPDYTLTNGALSYLNEQGKTKYRILGTKLIHYDDDASIDITQPKMRSFQPDKAPVTVRAKRGQIDGDLSILDLYDNVEIYRPPQAASESQKASPHMLARSSYFQVFINDDVIKTNKPMELEQGLSVMNSTEGGIFNNVQQSMTLLGLVKGRIEPAQQGSK
ncbi:MAG: LPS export ABC transporter periplasmic protein LptC [Polynucleobacter sp.]|jgi:lipopolysaccharide export system protein LptC|nr:LPS export ABC transporter periplasmic protein LptC [Polynucleobacter sp.]MDZ4056925.1 LPS export ABC transporter periplasmic protein LptC [Polynucleobacter sp.]